MRLPPTMPDSKPRPIPGGGRLIGGYFCSSKAPRPLSWVGTLQLDYLRLAEIDLSISTIADQALRLAYRLDGRRRTWTPPFLVSGRTGETIVTVLYECDRVRPSTSARLEALRHSAAARDYGFEVHTETTLRRQPRLDNAKTVLLSRGHQVPENVAHALLTIVRKGPRLLGDLRILHASPTAELDILSLCRSGVLSIDLDRPLNALSLVTIREA